MRRARIVLFIVGCFHLPACSWFRSEPPKLFPVNLCLHGSPQLQWRDGSAHTLFVRVYPLTAADAFNATEMTDLIAEPPPTLAGSVGASQWRTLYPNGTVTLSFDAPAGQEFSMLGVVAGYYKPQGRSKILVNAADLRTGSCYTIEFGPAGIEGGAPAPVPTKGEDE